MVCIYLYKSYLLHHVGQENILYKQVNIVFMEVHIFALNHFNSIPVTSFQHSCHLSLYEIFCNCYCQCFINNSIGKMCRSKEMYGEN